MAILEFKNYIVNNMSYIKNKNFDRQDNEINLKPIISADFNRKDDTIDVKLTVLIGSLEDKKMPFKIECEVVGEFKYNADKNDTKISEEAIIKNNTVAILYPYIRQLISSLTQQSNEYPSYILPTINVTKVLKEKDK
ncbi:protein-export chaperone SecB [Lactobacillus paragasseri]|uniref:protein-export chaperone SecB n=1 Tax=Lactobacillus paragasseri TaxID=2107999 RepID=UPI000F6ED974|nr:protein-export chaperone SecB [Lactobacillus paragasseri]VEF35735.1 preprotein translocase subunit SecB [Lactobacillus paragasseri]